MRLLTIDIGNTAVKGSVFDDETLLGSALAEGRKAEALLPLVAELNPQAAICCSVGNDADEFIGDLKRETGIEVMALDQTTPLPIAIEYGTPGTLGLDRVAAAVGASLMAESALVVDAGTAMTLDVVAENAFKGGNISPGLRLRFRSLNCFTSRLPLVKPAGDLPEFGYDTETALRSGVVNGIVDEIENTFHRGDAVYRGLRLLLTGGDADYLSPLLLKRGLQPEIIHSLVGRGLCEIYKYNMTAARL